MEKFEVNILGCGSALPTTRHFPTSQVLNVRDKLFMIDCGEGAQLQFRKSRLKFSRLNRIFISHLHGDHCFGLPGLVSTLNLLGRTAELHIHAPRGAEEIFAPVFSFFNRQMSYPVLFHEFDTKEAVQVYEDRSLTVTTLPLRHRMPCCGFLFAEKQGANHIVREQVDFYQVPVYELNRIKNGADYVTPEGQTIPNAFSPAPSPPSLCLLFGYLVPAFFGGAGERGGPVVSRGHLCRSRCGPCPRDFPYYGLPGCPYSQRRRGETFAHRAFFGTLRRGGNLVA